MIVTDNNDMKAINRVKIYRWYFYIALTQFLMYFIVPILLFPGRAIVSIEVISALTIGLLVGMFLLLVSILGFFQDKARRVLYSVTMGAMVLYFIWAAVSWAYIEQMDYLLR
jgi:hypothetical protein